MYIRGKNALVTAFKRLKKKKIKSTQSFLCEIEVKVLNGRNSLYINYCSFLSLQPNIYKFPLQNQVEDIQVPDVYMYIVYIYIYIICIYMYIQVLCIYEELIKHGGTPTFDLPLRRKGDFFEVHC